ncbi:MAG: hypothetical protein K0B06_07545 [Brevefilum sp.]|nr:hypothetical protein [Brevefilum sp.]
MDSKSLCKVLLTLCLVMLTLSLPACSLFDPGETALSSEQLAQTAIAQTVAVEQQVQTLVAQTLATSGQIDEGQPEATQVPEPTSTDAPEPTITPTATITLTPTPEKPMVSVSVNTNCRTGPGLQFDLIGSLLIGEQAEVVGVYPDGDYWIIKNPRRAGECWLWGNYATIVGQTAGLPVFASPPTPTPSFTPTPVYNWTGTWTTSFGKTGLMHETHIISLTQTNATVTGSFSLGASTVTLNGTLSTDYMTLTGTWSVLTDSGTFVFKLINMDQFIGNRDNGEYEWCGYRAGAGFPSPCMGP